MDVTSSCENTAQLRTVQSSPITVSACLHQRGTNHYAGKSPIIILQSQQSVLLWLEVGLRWLEDGSWEERRQELICHILLPSLLRKGGSLSCLVCKLEASHQALCLPLMNGNSWYRLPVPSAFYKKTACNTLWQKGQLKRKVSTDMVAMIMHSDCGVRTNSITFEFLWVWGSWCCFIWVLFVPPPTCIKIFNCSWLGGHHCRTHKYSLTINSLACINQNVWYLLSI